MAMFKDSGCLDERRLMRLNHLGKPELREIGQKEMWEGRLPSERFGLSDCLMNQRCVGWKGALILCV